MTLWVGGMGNAYCAHVVMNDGGREVLAAQAGLLRLVRVCDADGAEHFVLEVLGGEGAVVDSTRFAYEDFPLAASECSRRIVDALDSSIAEVTLAVTVGMMSFDHEAVAAVVHDDFAQVDLRPLGYPELDKAGFLDALDAQSDIVRVWLTQAMHAATPDVLVATGSFWTLNFDRWTPLNHAVYLDVLKDGKLVRMELYPEAQLDIALDRFAELRSSA